MVKRGYNSYYVKNYNRCLYLYRKVIIYIIELLKSFRAIQIIRKKVNDNYIIRNIRTSNDNNSNNNQRNELDITIISL